MAAMVELKDIIPRPDILLNQGMSSAIDSVNYFVKTFGVKSLITILTDKELEVHLYIFLILKILSYNVLYY